jgi:FlaA1/EpsC-like NDP-sugar epimerase
MLGPVNGRRGVVQAMLDLLAWMVALSFVSLIRNNLSVSLISWSRLAVVMVLAMVVQLVVGYAAALYRGRWRLGSFDEAMALATCTALTTAVVSLVVLIGINHAQILVPASTAVMAGFVALVLMAASRIAARVLSNATRKPRSAATRVLVFGAGDGGAQVVDAMLGDPNSPYLPVGFLDDDPSKRHLRHRGISVLGDRSRLVAVASRVRADALLIAIPSAGHQLMSELVTSADEAGIPVKVLPAVAELFGDHIAVSHIRELDLEDLLGRNPIETDLESIAGYLTGKRVLVTGAGGSIGSELCRQITRYAPSELIMLDRNENALHAVQLSIEGRALLDSPNIVLACIRDADAVEQAFVERQPEVVFHAAALKHQPILERYPSEALKTNVFGTVNVLRAATKVGVDRFVNVSTDKAADPASVLGYTKRIAERLTAEVTQGASGTYLSVRFGNVLGSDGSVLRTFRAQVDAGGPITVTHPDVTRYFMTVAEAVQLVIQAAAIGNDGEALVLDMGEPVRIDDVARRLASQAPRPINIVYTGLRPGEKCHEVLLGADEIDNRPMHPLISHVAVPPLPIGLLDRAAAPDLDESEITEELRSLVFRRVEALEL